MIYTICILCIGIYLGQEYTIIPSVRSIVDNIMFYLREVNN